MEINEDQPNEHEQRLFIQGLQGNQWLSLLFCLSQRQAEDWEDFIVEKKKTSEMPCMEAVGMGKVQVG